MTEKPDNATRLILTNDCATGRLSVDMEAFFAFSFWMAEELEDMVQRYRPKKVSRPVDLRRPKLRRRTKSE